MSVIYYHVAQRFFSDYYKDKNFIDIGKYGVELFFVLSGFLIGGLYYKNPSKVKLLKFWLQRFLRTYPPYLVTLFLSFLAVYKVKHITFDGGYFFFIQNFYKEIPFFKISWSLCVEEHFYLLFPFVILLIKRFNNKNLTLLFWICLCLLPSILRIFFGDSTNTTHGYYVTATIFRFDGIAVGCLIAFIINNYSISYKPYNFINVLLIITMVVAAYWISNSRSFFTYTIGYFIFILNVGALLFTFYFSKDFYLSKFTLVKRIALMAYSLYLTNALVINVSELIVNKLHLISAYSILIVSSVIIFMVGIIYYRFVEKPAIDFRKKVLA